MGDDRAWRVLGAGAGVLMVAAVLLSPMDLVFTEQVAFVDTELRQASASADTVRTKLDFADKEQLESIPSELGAWQQVRAYEWADVARLLDAHVLLSRDYARADLLQPVNLLIIQSGNVTSFHPAPVCYTIQGWDIAEGRTARVPLTEASWATPAWLSEDEPNVFDGNLSAKVTEVTKTRPDGSVDRRAVMYVYVKQESGHVTNAITWVRLEMPVVAEAGLDDVMPILGDLFRAAVPSLFDPEEHETPTIAEHAVARWGFAGGAAIALAVLAPAAIAVPWRRRPG